MLEIPVIDFSIREKYVYDFYKNIIQKNDTVIDVGASVGLHTVQLLKLVGLTGHVVAIEPVINCANELKKYQFKNGPQLTIINAVANSECSQVKFIVHDEIGYSCVKDFGYTNQPGNEIEISAITIDSLNLAPKFIKIDTEGFELNVLKGCTNTIKNSRPFFTIETENNIEVMQFFADFNYKCLIKEGFDLLAIPS